MKHWKTLALAISLAGYCSSNYAAIPFTGTITGDATLSVAPSGEFPTIQSAFDYLWDKRIAPSAIVTISVSGCPYNNHPTITVDHPDGNRIHIIGDNCTINFASDSHGLYLTNGQQLGLIDGFTFSGQGTSYGMYATDGAIFTAGPNMLVRSFSYGVVAHRNSTIRLEPNFRTEYNTLSGVYAALEASILASSTTSANNGNSGYHSNQGGSIVAKGSTSQGNSGYGYFSTTASYLNATTTSTTTKGNALGAYRPATSNTVDSSGAVITFN